MTYYISSLTKTDTFTMKKKQKNNKTRANTPLVESKKDIFSLHNLSQIITGSSWQHD